MTMDKARQGEIALLLIKKMARDKGVRLTPNFKREIGAEAKNIGISTEEAMAFAEIVIVEMIGEMFLELPKNERDAHDRMGTARVLRELAAKYDQG